MFDCSTCTEGQKKAKGCFGEAQSPCEIDGEEYDTCPMKLVTPYTWQIIRLYGHYKNGLLIYSGGLIDQPAKYLQAMELVEREIMRNSEENGRERRIKTHHQRRPR